MVQTLAAPSVEPLIAPTEAEAGTGPDRPRGATFRRRLLGATALTVLAAMPIAVQVELASARRVLEADRQDHRVASASVRAQRSLVTSTDRKLSVADAHAAAAADEVARARVLLAASGVEEQAILTVLEQTRLWLDTVSRQRSDVIARIGQQELELPAAKECVLEGNRALGRQSGTAPCPVAPAP